MILRRPQEISRPIFGDFGTTMSKPGGLGAVVFRGKGVRARSSNRPIEAINQRFEVFGFELIKAPKVSDDSLTNGAGIGPEGLNELKVASSA